MRDASWYKTVNKIPNLSTLEGKGNEEGQNLVSQPEEVSAEC